MYGYLNHYNRTSILVLHQGTVIETLISLNLEVGKRFSKRLSDSFHSVVMRQASHISVGKFVCHCLCWPNTTSQTYYTWYMCMLRLQTLGKFVSCDIVHDIETTYLGFLVYLFLQHMLYSTVCRAIESFTGVALCVKMNLQIRPLKTCTFQYYLAFVLFRLPTHDPWLLQRFSILAVHAQYLVIISDRWYIFPLETYWHIDGSSKLIFRIPNH